MGFASPLLLALLGLSGVDGFGFGGMREPDAMMPRAFQPRQIECNSGSTACGMAGCISTAACCNAEADWSCLEGNACYTIDGMVDCYTTTMALPTVSRSCYDYTQSGCRGGLTCFQCKSTAYGYCVTTVLEGQSETWLNCAAKSTIKTTSVNSVVKTTVDSSGATSSPKITSSPTSPRTTSSRTTSTPIDVPTPSPTGDKGGLSGGAIAGIAIGSFAGLTIVAVSLFLCLRKKPTPQPPVAPVGQPQPPVQGAYPGYQPPPFQNDPMGQYPQPPYSPPPHQYPYPGAPGGYPPPTSPVYGDPTKEPSRPTTFPAELAGNQN